MFENMSMEALLFFPHFFCALIIYSDTIIVSQLKQQETELALSETSLPHSIHWIIIIFPSADSHSASFCIILHHSASFCIRNMTHPFGQYLDVVTNHIQIYSPFSDSFPHPKKNGGRWDHFQARMSVCNMTIEAGARCAERWSQPFGQFGPGRMMKKLDGTGGLEWSLQMRSPSTT